MSVIDLYFREYGRSNVEPLILLHGLFGSSMNWMGIARRLESDFRVLIPDLRNHGRSPHSEQMDYAGMAQDLLGLMNSQAIRSAHFIGHSMGGKIAMWLALAQPERVEKLVVVDVAPVTYDHQFEAIFTGLAGIDLQQLPDRQAADQLLARQVRSGAVRQYLLQNLVKTAGAWRWRFNLPVLRDRLSVLTGFPDAHDRTFPGDVLCIYGAQSDYVKPEYIPAMRRLFPFARLRMLAGAGHWVYAEQPEGFSQAVRAFL